MGYYRELRREQRARQVVDRIQTLTHRVTRYNVKELRSDGRNPRGKGPPAKRQHAARVMREWRRVAR